MAKSKKQLHDELRAKYMEIVKNCLEENGEEVLRTNSNEFAIPCVDSEGNDEFLVFTFKVPTGSREGDAYDGYDEADAYRIKSEQKAEKAAAAAEAKAKKIAKDKAQREAKAAAKAAHQTEGEGRLAEIRTKMTGQ